MTDIFQGLELNVIYNTTNIRNFLKKECNDAVSLPTTAELLKALIEAQELGLQFKINDKIRKLVEKKSISKGKQFELIEL